MELDAEDVVAPDRGGEGAAVVGRGGHVLFTTRPEGEPVREVEAELGLAAVEAVEEAILNSLTAAETEVGRDGNTAHALPLDRVRALLGL